MKRESILIDKSPDGRIEIHVDKENSAAILNYLQTDLRHKKKFQFIKGIVLGGHKNDVFTREDINDDCKDVYAMRFFVGQENDRIYCKRVVTAKGIVIVICCELHIAKKTTKLSHIEKELIIKVAKYEYEF